jgi:multidrug efflux pump
MLLLADNNVSVGIEAKFRGEQCNQAKELAFLSSALLLVVLFILFIRVAQFNKNTGLFINIESVLLDYCSLSGISLL